MDYQQEKYQKERQAKQQFLVESILEQGYNPSDFAQFMAEKKENGIDVDSWTFTQLSYLVEEFKLFAKQVYEQQQLLLQNQQENQEVETEVLDQYYSHKAPVYQDPQNAEQIHQQIPQVHNQYEEDLLQSQKQMSQIQVSEVFQDRVKSVKTITIMPTVLNQANTTQIDIFVLDGLVEQHKKLLKTTTNLTFRVQTPRFQWDVRRNDQDFNILHQYLTKLYPHILLPPISSFKAGKKYESVFIKKRARILEKFLRCLMRSDELKSNYILLQFLQSIDKKEYENIMKLAEKEQGVFAVKDLITITGEIKINETQYSYFMRECEELPTFVKSLEGNYRRLYQQMKRFGEDLKSISMTIQNIQESVSQLSQTHQQFSPEKQGLGLPQLLNLFGETLTQWSQSYLLQKQVFNENLVSFFHYYALQGDQIQQFYQNIQNRLEDIKKKEKALNERKEKLFNGKDPQQWDLPNFASITPDELQMLLKDKSRAFQLMLPKESAAIVELKDMFTILVQSFKFEVGKAEDFTFTELKDQLAHISEPIMKSYHNHLMIWNQFDQKIKNTL